MTNNAHARTTLQMLRDADRDEGTDFEADPERLAELEAELEEDEDDAVDLETVKRAHSSTPSADRNRCPECHSVNISPTKHGVRGPDTDTNYWCEECDARFNDPVQTATDGGLERETIPVCPECGRGSVHVNAVGGMSSPEHDPDTYECKLCHATFDEPEHRERKRQVQIRGDTIAGKLEAAEPGDLITDGGQELPRFEYDRGGMSTGDVVVDLASGKSLQVVGKSTQPVGEHPKTRSDETAALFGADADETVFNCVFLPDGERVSAPTKTYAYPASRLLRYPVENATDYDGTMQTWLRTVFLDELADGLQRAGNDDLELAVAALIKDVYNPDIARTFHELIDSKRSASSEDQENETDGDQEIATDGGFEIAPMPYRCRICGDEQKVYVTITEIGGERWIDVHNRRLYTGDCDSCEAETVHVLAVGDVDAAREGHPIGAVAELLEQADDDETDTDQDAGENTEEPFATDGGTTHDRYRCALCGSRYRSPGTAMQCCTDAFDDDDDGSDPPVDVRTDGGIEPRGPTGAQTRHLARQADALETVADRLEAQNDQLGDLVDAIDRGETA